MRAILVAAVFLIVATLASAGCGDKCSSNDHTLCREGRTYWVDSCGNEGSLAEDCACGCNDEYTGCREECCQPECADKQCGDDGCGGECPPGCADDQTCDEQGQCMDICSPACTPGALRCQEGRLQICSDQLGCPGWEVESDCAALHRSCDEALDPVDCGACLDGYVEIAGACRSVETCQVGTCSGHGSCDDASGTPVCTCDQGYTGEWCDICAEGFVHWPEDGDVCLDDPCDPDPCEVQHAQAGTCIQTDPTAVDCSCDAGYLWNGADCVPEEQCTDSDQDGCGVGAGCACSDCNDTDPDINPQAVEMCDGKDNDCDLQTDEDFDELGQECDGPDADLCPNGFLVCNPTGEGVECGTESVENIPEECNDLDDDCDGSTDEDIASEICEFSNGFGTCTGMADCQPQQGMVCDAPIPAQEECNGLDEDCDGAIDEDVPEPADPCENMVPGVGTCVGDWICQGQGGWHCNAAMPVVESCNGLDEDCDGATDEDVPEPADPCENMVPGVGTCVGDWICQGQGGWHCNAEMPVVESCNGLDDDCDSDTDEDFTYEDWDGSSLSAGMGCGTGSCAGGVTVCSLDGSALTCSTLDEAGPEQCDDLDNDCDGTTDIDDTFVVHPHEPNDSCNEETFFGNLEPFEGTISLSDEPRLYPGQDQDFYSIYAEELTDPPFDCIPVVCEERYRMTFTLIHPADGQDFQLCASGSSCNAQTCTGGDILELAWSGTCSGDDDRSVYFSVRSPDASSFDCHPYEVQISYETWLVDGAFPGCPGARRR